jgi:hypothetical protein
MAACEQRRSQLFSKQGRTNQFRSREQRDEWINNELRSLANAISTKESHIHGLREAVQQLNASKDSKTKEMRVTLLLLLSTKYPGGLGSLYPPPPLGEGEEAKLAFRSPKKTTVGEPS